MSIDRLYRGRRSGLPVRPMHDLWFLLVVTSVFFFTGTIALAQPATVSGLNCEITTPDPEPSEAEVNPTLLRADQILRASQPAEKRTAYEFEALSTQRYLIEVTQEQLDFIVTVESPDGHRRTFNSPLRRNAGEFVLLETPSAGTHRITLYSEENTGATGTHEIRIRAVSDAGDPQLEIWRLLSKGAELNYSGGDENSTQARQAYLAAAEHAAAGGDETLQAYALYAAAMIDYWHFTAMPEAGRMAEQVAGLYNNLNEPVLAASALFLQADALAFSSESQDNFAQSLRIFGQAAEIQERFGEHYALAHSVNSTALTYFLMGDLKHARQYWEQAAMMFNTEREYAGELLAIGNLASVDLDEGYLTSAVAGFEKVLGLQPPGKTLRHRVDVLSNLALAKRILNDFDDALRGFSCARIIAEQIDYAWGIGWALAGTGETYYAMGEMDLAEQYLQAALPAEQRAGDVRGEAVVLRYIGNIEHSRGDFQSALDHHQRAFDVSESAPDQVLAQLDIARDLSALGRHEQAVQLTSAALTSAEKAGSQLLEAEARLMLGTALLQAKNYQRAMSALEPAAATFAALNMIAEQARALNGLALSARGLGQPERAIQYGDASLNLVEQVRGSVADPELRAFYLSARRDYYELQIDLLMQRPGDADDAADTRLASALRVSERSRARMTLDLLQRGVIDLRGSDPSISDRRSELYTQLAEHRYRRDKMVRPSPQDQSGESLESVLLALADIENELILLETSAREAGTGAPEQSAPTLGLHEMQATLDADSALVQYALGASRSYVWVVTRETAMAAELPDADFISELARAVIEDLHTIHPSRKARTAAAERRQRLADVVLAPIRGQLTKKRLIIAADGILQYIPFGALPAEDSAGSSRPLIEHHEIVGIPSLSATAAQRQRENRRRPSKTVAVFADPVFEATDSRLAEIAHIPVAEPANTAEVLTLADLRSEIPLSRLPWTIREATAIQNLVPEENSMISTGFDASVATLAKSDLGDFRILHFATHGVIDTAYPDLSALVLSRYDASGAPQNGFLELRDIYELDLAADLVVLSACDTAIGREIRAEGLLGLTQGFMYAGAKSLMATLWPVSDQATAELMTVFYDNLLNSGARPAEALRQAQLEIASQPRWSEPYFWAGFVLIGNWR